MNESTDRYAEILDRLDIPRDRVDMLKLLPLVYVAWVGGGVEPSAAERIRHKAIDEMRLDRGALEQLDRWLAHRPSNGYFRDGLMALKRLAFAPDEPSLGFDELNAVMSHAEGVARVASSDPGAPWAVSTQERAALQRLSEMLNVDHGKTWASLLAELGTPLEAASGAPSATTQSTTVSEAEVATQFGAARPKPKASPPAQPVRRLEVAARAAKTARGGSEPSGGLV